MSSFQLSSNIDSNKIFLRKRSELEGRYDPYFYNDKFTDFLKNLIRNNELVKFSYYIESIANGLDQREFFESGTPYYKVANILHGTLDRENIQYIQIPDDLTKNIKLEKNNILLTRKGSFGRAYRVLENNDAIISSEVFNIKLKIPEYAEFIEIYLNLFFGQLQFDRHKIGAIMGSLSQMAIKNIFVPIIDQLPVEKICSLYEQSSKRKQQKEQEAQNLLDSIDDYLMKELGIELPEVDNSLDNRVFFIKKLKDLDRRLDPIFYYSNYQTIISNTSFSILKLGEIIVSAKSGFGAGKNDQVDSFEKGVIHIRPTNISREGQVIVDRCVFVPKQEGADFIQINDVLFNNTNSQELVGKTLLYDQIQKSYIESFFQVDNLETLYFSNHITRIRANELIVLPAYLALILNSYQKNNIFYSLCTNWNNQSGIGSDVLNSLKIPVPNLELQSRVVSHIESIREQAKQLQNEAQQQFETTKKEIERMILGEDLE